MTNPLVSIIVPVYNAQNSVARCLESICSQTYQELEIIVLNDGSTDDSLAICEQFRAKDPPSPAMWVCGWHRANICSSWTVMTTLPRILPSVW